MVSEEAVVEYLAGIEEQDALRIFKAARCRRGIFVTSFASIMCPERWLGFDGGLLVRGGRSATEAGRDQSVWTRCLRSIRLHREKLRLHLLHLAKQDGRFDLSRFARETDESYLRRLCCELQTSVIELQIDLSGISTAVIAPAGRCTLSLLDVAVLTGDPDFARFLASLGVPQRLAFESADFINMSTGLIQARNVCVIEAAACAKIDLRRDVSYSSWDPLPWNLFERSIAGKQKKAVDILRRYQFIPGSLFGVVFMRVAPNQGWRRHIRFFVDADRIQLAIHAGLDLRTVRVSPWHALWCACASFRSNYHSSDYMKFFDLPRFAWWNSEAKWRPEQTLLEIAINCGQKDIITPLVNLRVEANCLAPEELHAPSLDFRNLSINFRLSSLEAAGLAFRKSRFQHHLLIMQLSSWWLRVPHDAKSKVILLHQGLIDLISSFADPMPKLLEFQSFKA